MSSQLEESAEEIQHLIRTRIHPAFPDFLACRNSQELAVLPRYCELQHDIRRALETAQTRDFRRTHAPSKERYRVVAWNIERGTQLEGQLAALRNNAFLRDADVLLLIETDIGMARSGNLDIARTMAEELGFSYAFIPCYLSLVKGSGVERKVQGDNRVGLHGNAILSRYPITNIRRIALENGIDKIASREKRLGSQTAVAAAIEFPQRSVSAVSAHLCAQSSQHHRMEQMRQILDVLPEGPAIIGGDWNTSTYDSSRALYAILGFWRRVFMGVDHVIRNHYLYPENYFERELFQLLEQHAFDYKSCNVIGDYTVRYDMRDPRADGSLREWVPDWCFPFIYWSLRNHNGCCPFKLDWFAARGVTAEHPTIIHEPRDGSHTPLSDHDAIGVDIRLT